MSRLFIFISFISLVNSISAQKIDVKIGADAGDEKGTGPEKYAPSGPGTLTTSSASRLDRTGRLRPIRLKARETQLGQGVPQAL